MRWAVIWLIWWLPALAWAQVESRSETITLDNGDTMVIDQGETVVIKGKRATKPGNTTLAAKDAALVAGVQGDALKAVRSIGGVARTPPGTGGLSVWGAAPADTRLYVDNVPIPRLFHMGGARSVLPSHAVDEITLIPGGASARYGRAIGGAVVVTSSQPDLAGSGDLAMGAHADLFDAGLSLSSQLGKASWLSFSGRTSLLSQIAGAVSPQRSRELIPIPDYTDGQVRAVHHMQDGNVLRILAISSSDHSTRGIASMRSDENFHETMSANFQRVALSLERERPHDSRTLTFWIGRDRDTIDLSFDQSSASDLQQKKAMGLLLLREARVAYWLQVRYGVDAEIQRSRFTRSGASTLPSREGDIQVFGQPPGNRVNEDQWSVTNAGVGMFVTSNFRIGQRLQIESGLRFEPNIVNGNRVLPVRPSEPEVGYTELQFSANPRLRISFQPTSTVQLFSAAGGYQQPAAATDLSPVFGSPVLKQGRSWQLLVGTQIAPSSWFRGELVAYTAKQDQLTSRSALPTPPLAGLLSSDGQGKSMGAQATLHASLPGRASASLSYAASRAERRRDSNSLWRPFDLDQQHQLRAAAQWSTDYGLQLGGTFELSSGMPRTPVEDAVFNTSSQRHDPIFGWHNSDRLPTFVSLSLRAGYERKKAWGMFRVWLDVVNATNRRNVEEVFYSFDFSSRGFIEGLPILPVIGAELWL